MGAVNQGGARMVTYGIFHFRAGELKGERFEADSEAAALRAWADSKGFGRAVTLRADGRPTVRFVLCGTDIILHEYTACATNGGGEGSS